jgi:hypothetical protein
MRNRFAAILFATLPELLTGSAASSVEREKLGPELGVATATLGESRD